MGWTLSQIHELTNIDPWFLAQMKELTDFESELKGFAKANDHNLDVAHGVIERAKRWGYSDIQLSQNFGCSADRIRQLRISHAITPVYKIVDTCAAEFEAATPYYYSTYETPYIQLKTNNPQPTKTEDEIRLTDKPKVIIIGGGPNRIGQGLNSTTAACRPRSRCASWASNRS